MVSIDLIREAFHYQSRYQGATFVFKIDAPLVEHQNFSYLMRDIALLAKNKFRVVIVPGAKERIDRVLHEYGILTPTRNGIRITTGKALPFVEMATFHGATRFMTELRASGVDAIIGNFVRARGLGIIEGIDFEHTGTVERIISDSIQRILDQAMVVILPCIGLSRSGRVYNVLSTEIAVEGARALKAAKLFLLSAHSDLKIGDRSINRLSPHEAEALKRSVPGNSFLQQTVDTALKAIKGGIERVHILDGTVDGVILHELFSNVGVGTMISADEYESIRALEERDIPVILRLMEPLVRAGYLIRRSEADIREKYADYVVFVVDGSIHACGALHNWGEEWAEIAALATDPAYSALGYGRSIVSYLIDRAKKQHFSTVFVLTTRTQDWFESLGFHEESVEQLPPLRKACYNPHRKSKVFVLNLRGQTSEKRGQTSEEETGTDL
ncbi:amino-acid N-acetyltransferase [Pillotina sp. SPG140]|jgi:amino-acid N-acetyltransferase